MIEELGDQLSPNSANKCKLSRYLKSLSSLNSYNLFISHVSASSLTYNSTLTTLLYGSKASHILLFPKPKNAIDQEDSTIVEHEKRIKTLEKKLGSLKDSVDETMVEDLNNDIEYVKSQIITGDINSIKELGEGVMKKHTKLLNDASSPFKPRLDLRKSLCVKPETARGKSTASSYNTPKAGKPKGVAGDIAKKAVPKRQSTTKLKKDQMPKALQKPISPKVKSPKKQFQFYDIDEPLLMSMPSVKNIFDEYEKVDNFETALTLADKAFLEVQLKKKDDEIAVFI